MELFEEIRREFEFESGSVRAVAKKLGVHRRMVRQALADATPPERKVPERKSPQIEALAEFIDQILEADQKAPRKQRHTSHRIWTRIQDEKPGSEVGESTIRRYVGKRKHELGLLKRERFVPQSYIQRAEPVIFIGECGTGKTHLTTGLCVAACRGASWR